MRFKILILISMISVFYSCKKKTSDPGVPTIININISKFNIPGAPDLNISEENIKNRIIKSIKEDSDFNVVAGGKKSDFKKPYAVEVTWTVRPVQITPSVRIKGKVLNRLVETGVEIVLRPLFQTDFNKRVKFSSATAIRFSSTDVKNLDKRIKRSLLDTVDEVTAHIWLENKLFKASPDVLIKYLKSEKLSYRKLAVSIVGRRKIRQASSVLIKMLKSEHDVSFVMRIAGVLGVLKDEKAVEPLSNLALMMTPEHTVAILNIIANIGGKDAETFLHWMSTSHKNKDVRKAAARLIENLPPSSE